jgi:5-methylcytosine-specific restriction protein A
MIWHLCPRCGTRTRTTGRCPDCRRAYQHAYDQQRGSSSQRGYGSEWRKLRAAVIQAQPWCSFCGHTGSRDNPLSVDHIVPRAQGGTDDPSNLRVLCLTHNRRRPRGSNAEQPTGKRVELSDVRDFVA